MTVMILAIIFIVFIGNFMSAKPSTKEVQLDSVRMTARRLELNPKLIKTPEWLLNHNTQNKSEKVYYDYSKTDTPMLMQYSLVNDDWRLPKACFLIENNQLILFQIDNQNNAKTYLERQVVKLSDNAKKIDKLNIADFFDKKHQDILPFLKGIMIQANSISLYFYDEKWANTLGDRLKNYPQSAIMVDNEIITDKMELLNKLVFEHLMALKTAMTAWAEQVLH